MPEKREQTMTDEQIDAVRAYLEAQDALDNREYQGINGEDWGTLRRRRNLARDDLDKALSAVPTPAPTMVDERGKDILQFAPQFSGVSSPEPTLERIIWRYYLGHIDDEEKALAFAAAYVDALRTALATRPTLQSLGGDAGVSEEKHAIEGTVTFMRSDPEGQVCVCCPKGGGHIFSRGIKWDAYETHRPEHFGSSANVFVDSRITDYNANEGRRVRLTVELLPVAPKSAEKSGRSE